MNSCEVLRAIDAVAALSGKNDKASLLTTYMIDPTFERVMSLMLNPLTAYYIKPSRAKSFGDRGFSDQTWQLFDDLTTRKLSGHRAIEVVKTELSNLTPESSELLWRILHRDPRAGFGAGSVNKITPKLIPEVPYMRCSLPSDVNFDLWPWAEGVFVQVKADGTFINVTIRDGGVTISSRTGFEWPLEYYDEIAMTFSAFPDGQYHGEMLVMQDGQVLDREIGNGMLNSVNDGNPFPLGCTPTPVLWNVIPLEAVTRRGKCDTPYKQRFQDLCSAVAEFGGAIISTIENHIVHSLDEAYALSAKFIKAKKEGAVVKHPDGPWKDTGSSGSPDNVKIKMKCPCELKIVGYLPGKGKRASAFGSLLCRSECGMLEVGISGFSDELLAQINSDRDGWLGRIITVTFNDITKPKKGTGMYSLYLAQFDDVRPDRIEADSLERIQQQFQDAKDAVGLIAEAA